MGANKCNLKAPTIFTDEGEILDKSLLPIQTVSYGPLRFEAESATITIGALKCDPKPRNSEERSLKAILREYGNRLDKIDRGNKPSRV